jgi:hypothetical protein
VERQLGALDQMYRDHNPQRGHNGTGGEQARMFENRVPMKESGRRYSRVLPGQQMQYGYQNTVEVNQQNQQRHGLESRSYV